MLAEKNGADSVTIHLREDRRHINELDLKKIIKRLKITLNLEIAATREMLKIAQKVSRLYMVVPEKGKKLQRKEVYLDHNKNF